DLDTTHQISQCPKDLIVRWARDMGTVKPAAIHSGEGVNHWFQRTANGRACAMITIITGNQGKFGTGFHNWSGNYKTGIPQGTPWSGYGIGAWAVEDPFHLNLDPNAHGKEMHAKYHDYGEEPAYWNHWYQVWKGGIRPLYDTRNDLDCYIAVASKWAEITGDKRFTDVWKFAIENKVDVYIQRVLDSSSTLYGYNAKTLLQSEKGW